MGFRHRERFGHDHPYQQLIREIVAARTTDRTGVLVSLAWDAFSAALGEAEPWAVQTIEPTFREALNRDITNEMRYQGGQSRAYIGKDGQGKDIPLDVGYTPHRDDGTAEEYYQRALFIDLSRAEARAVLARQARIADTESGKVAAYERYFEIWDQHPDAPSARVACEVAGIDPFNILPDEEQAV
jgi:hypothetical protein